MKKISIDQQKILDQFPEIYRKILPGLEKGKCLFKDGLMNLSMEELENIDFCEFIILLCIHIQAHPKKTLEYQEDQMVEMCNLLKMGISFCVICKLGLMEFYYGLNKINLKRKFSITIEEEIAKKFNLRVSNEI